MNTFRNKSKECCISFLVILFNLSLLIGTGIYFYTVFDSEIKWKSDTIYFKDFNDPICQNLNNNTITNIVMNNNNLNNNLNKNLNKNLNNNLNNENLNEENITKCFQEKFIEIIPEMDKANNISVLVSLFFSNATTVDLIYFKSFNDFLKYNTTHWLDPTSINYEVLNGVKMGFKFISFNLMEDYNQPIYNNHTNNPVNPIHPMNQTSFIPKNSNYNNNNKLYNNDISKNIYIIVRRTIEKSQDISTFTPMSFSTAYFLIYSYPNLMLNMFLIISLILFDFITILFWINRIQKIFHSERLIEAILPISLQKLLCVYREKRDYNQFAEIKFTNLSLKKFDSTPILKSITGVIPPGRVTAVMGGSGSGKTSFITALCQRAYYGMQEGEITINGQTIHSESMKRLIAYVPQDDIMLPNLTIEETLYFNAICRDVDLKSCSKRVYDTLEMLKLNHKRKSIIGDVNDRGISGGEKKRVNVGIEAVVSPPILILDEPTSGLDSESALLLCSSLQELSKKKNMNIICVIHQPSFEIFEKFDDLMLFKNGELISHNTRELISDTVVHFCHEKKMKQYLNPADTIIKMLNNEECCNLLKSQMNNHLNYNNNLNNNYIQANHVSPFIVQFLICLIRSILQLFRDFFDLIIDLFLNTIGGLLIGVIYNNNVTYQGPPKREITYQCPPTLQSICSLPLQDNIAPFTSLMVLGVALTSMMSSLKVFGKERINFLRESQSGINSLTYFIVKDCCAFLYMISGSIMFTVSFYFLAKPVESFSFYFLLLLLLSCTTFPLGYIISIVMPPQLAQVTSVVIVFIFYIFSGVTPTLQEISEMVLPIPIMPYISYLRYIRELLYLGELNTYSDKYFIKKSMQLQDYVLNDKNIYLGIIIVFLVIHRILAYLILWQFRPNSFSNGLIYFVKSTIIGSVFGKVKKMLNYLFRRKKKNDMKQLQFNNNNGDNLMYDESSNSYLLAEADSDNYLSFNNF
ncbi:hypothetical protein ABK040_006149 [Willaertia magna]